MTKPPDTLIQCQFYRILEAKKQKQKQKLLLPNKFRSLPHMIVS